ncbi:MAG: ATP-binding protein [Candidatus Riflebacteria bacterium]|nr:ATP-binding protein [Candidatus Riflebacteria bacterium]
MDFPRLATESLESWSRRPERRPLVIRGARQVGKSHLVRSFAQRAGFELLELDLELQRSAASFFEADSPRQVLRNLEGHTGKRIVPGRTLLFLDEIQAVPRAFTMLRYFFEQVPELHVLAAGSLLELHPGEHAVPVPVGRLEHLELGPMTFDEYVLACGNEPLAERLRSFRVGEEFPKGLHLGLLNRFREYLVVGGMPGVVRALLSSGSLAEAVRVQRSLLRTFEDDFGKYRDRADTARLRKVFTRVPGLVGSVVKYSHIDPDDRAAPLATALELLCRARVVFRVHRSACNQVPLAAEEDARRFKLLALDVGLLSEAWGLAPAWLGSERELVNVRSGAVAEQVVGTHLLTSRSLVAGGSRLRAGGGAQDGPGGGQGRGNGSTALAPPLRPREAARSCAPLEQRRAVPDGRGSRAAGRFSGSLSVALPASLPGRTGSSPRDRARGLRLAGSLGTRSPAALQPCSPAAMHIHPTTQPSSHPASSRPGSACRYQVVKGCLTAYNATLFERTGERRSDESFGNSWTAS